MITIRINDITCGGCAGRVQRAIAAADANAQTEFSIAERIVRVSATVQVSALLAAIRNAGYSPEQVIAPAP